MAADAFFGAGLMLGKLLPGLLAIFILFWIRRVTRALLRRIRSRREEK